MYWNFEMFVSQVKYLNAYLNYLVFYQSAKGQESRFQPLEQLDNLPANTWL